LKGHSLLQGNARRKEKLQEGAYQERK